MLKSRTRKDSLTIKKLNKKIEKLEQEKMNMYEQVLLTSADFENYKKRATREQLGFKKFANQELLQELLTMVDDIEKIINYLKDSSVIEGINFILTKINTMFKKFNVEPIKAIGQQFNPEFHQAMGLEETGEYPSNTILSELQRGYMIHDRLLRPSMVIVSTKIKEK